MPADRLIIVTEGKTDVLIIRKLLSAELTCGIRFFAAQGRESLVTLGRNLLVHEGGPVLLVMDVATAELQSRGDMTAETMRALGAVGAPGAFDVFAFTPEIEVVFFEAPDALQRVLKTTLTVNVLKEGLVKPKPTLMQLMVEVGIPNTEVLIRKFDEEATQSISRGKQAMALREKVRTFCRVDAAAGA